MSGTQGLFYSGEIHIEETRGSVLIGGGTNKGVHEKRMRVSGIELHRTKERIVQGRRNFPPVEDLSK